MAGPFRKPAEPPKKPTSQPQKKPKVALRPPSPASPHSESLSDSSSLPDHFVLDSSDYDSSDFSDFPSKRPQHSSGSED